MSLKNLLFAAAAATAFAAALFVAVRPEHPRMEIAMPMKVIAR